MRDAHVMRLLSSHTELPHGLINRKTTESSMQNLAALPSSVIHVITEQQFPTPCVVLNFVSSCRRLWQIPGLPTYLT